ncbi:threonine--tRNA ligase [Dehalogenimonas alkenigignens]|uniref:Threonine--tRNA ligase n=1 Tax=Dehalogenimonas alkenigignens TaxID=1217799 RepID=A0A0W0GJA3_9CHLR|nr:threonine--tRNA ligase [Dehalogenimonas alkenigignens]KTB48634.1 threonyl-tRNA synthetase [Dehalogenimonas alkenigignens]PVV84932.1 threonine--tRNA ligase [Dehalogenimonas alkenigignens]
MVHGTPSEALDIMRHSAAHILAYAVSQLFPGTKLGIGPAIENGFYYDFELSRALSQDDLPLIEAKMNDIVKQNLPFMREAVGRMEAEITFADQPYKLELLSELPADEDAILYRNGDFVDLCKGPHVSHTARVKAFKLLSIAGAYWRGNEKRPMLQRIYGAAFQTKSELDEYLKRLAELEARDHRRINKQLNLFATPDEIGGGLVIYGPKAGRIRTTIEEFWRREHYDNGYEILYSPHIGRSTLWEISGHLANYKDIMYSPMDIDGQDYYVKPMNCPFHILYYKSQARSYRDLPLRWAELGTVYRYERSGVLTGLLRVRGFTQDDAHIICTPEQIESEISEVINFSFKMWNTFGFKEHQLYLATRPEKAIGTEEQWQKASDALKRVLDAQGLDYKIDEGGGAFYGPKIDLKVKDALGREWQMTTIQFDFNLPERFEMVYTGADGQEHRPYMVHRALLGSWERFFGLLIEHYAGAFPVWLHPVQAAVLPISDRHIEYARKLAENLKLQGIRVYLDQRSETINQKIRQAQLEKIPCMLVIGDKEIDNRTVAVRLRTGEQKFGVGLEEFKESINTAIRDRLPNVVV